MLAFRVVLVVRVLGAASTATPETGKGRRAGDVGRRIV
jgi:hypothetical protein